MKDLIPVNPHSGNAGDVAAIAALPYVGAGWYMLELAVISPDLRIKLDLVAVDSVGNRLASFPLDVNQNRLAKRLVRLSFGCSLSLYRELGKSAVVISAFRLVRVSRSFAEGRMLLKLKALHPVYRSRPLSLFEKKLRKPDSAAIQLWRDYDTLFRAGAHLFSYASWLGTFSRLRLGAATAPTIGAPGCAPRFTVILPTFKPSIRWITQAIQSVLHQKFQDWELIVVDDGSGGSDLHDLLMAFAGKDHRIKFYAYPENRHISAASNHGLAHASGEWVVFLDHDDLLDETALWHVEQAIANPVDCAMVYSDVDKIDEQDARSEPYFKPDWNPDLFLSQNLFSHLGAYKADLVREVGGFRVGYEGSQDYDLALRCMERIRLDQIVHIPRVLYHWRIHAGSTAHAMDAKPYAMKAGERALNDHLRRTGVDATAEAVGYGYRVRYALPPEPPLVSLVIPTRNGLKLLRQCVESIFAKTDYLRYEIIIVDNGSDDKATLRYQATLAARPYVRVMRDDRPFNYSALNNAAVAHSRGEVVALLNNDLEVIDAGWLTELVSHAVRPGVGAVGARLWYSDDTLQHAGVILGIHGVAGHVHRFLPRGNVGYCGRAALIQSFSAVTGACMVVRKSLYNEVGGLNEVELPVACNDIDFCLKLQAAGYRNVWTPYAELYHHESASRGLDDTPEKLARSAIEVAYMKQHWGDLLANDPAYNPNLTLDAEDLSLAWPPRLPEFDTAFDEVAALSALPLATSATCKTGAA